MQQHVVKNTGQTPWRRNWDDGSVSAVLLTTLWLNKMLSISAPYFLTNCLFCLGFKFTELYQALWEAWAKTVTVPSQGTHNASCFPPLVPNVYLWHTTLCFFQHFWEMTVFQPQGFQLDQNYLRRQRQKTSSEKRTQHVPTTSYKHFPPWIQAKQVWGH